MVSNRAEGIDGEEVEIWTERMKSSGQDAANSIQSTDLIITRTLTKARPFFPLRTKSSNSVTGETKKKNQTRKEKQKLVSATYFEPPPPKKKKPLFFAQKHRDSRQEHQTKIKQYANTKQQQKPSKLDDSISRPN